MKGGIDKVKPKILNYQIGNKATGFSLLELVLVIFIVGFLVAVLVPKLNELHDDAHTSAVRLSMTSLRAAVNLSHGLWESSSRETGDFLLEGYGEQDLIMNKAGWPVAVMDSQWENRRGSQPYSASTCVKLWNALLKDSAPQVSANDTSGYSYQAEYSKGHCRYRYRISQDDLRIEYDLKTGRVELLSDSEKSGVGQR